MVIVTEPQEVLREWISKKLNQNFPVDSTFIGQIKENKLVAVIGYCNFVGKSCAIHIASEGSHWMSRKLLWASFDYPFNKLEKKVIVTALDANNQKAVRLNRHLGFNIEAVIKDAHENGDLMIMTMRKENCRFLKTKE
jgi:RimJ/RimL family protein N-acetyltransferase